MFEILQHNDFTALHIATLHYTFWKINLYVYMLQNMCLLSKFVINSIS